MDPVFVDTEFNWRMFLPETVGPTPSPSPSPSPSLIPSPSAVVPSPSPGCIEALYSSDGTNLYTVDIVTGNRTLVGPHGFNIRSMGWDPRTETMYGGGPGSDGYDIYTISISNGAAVRLGDNPPFIIPGDWAMNPSDTSMYVAEFREVWLTDVPVLSSWTAKITSPCCDPGAALATKPNGQSYLARYNDIYPVDLGPGTIGTGVAITGNTDGIRGMTYWNGVFYAIDITGTGGTGRFGEIDPLTGVFTPISGAGTWMAIAAVLCPYTPSIIISPSPAPSVSPSPTGPSPSPVASVSPSPVGPTPSPSPVASVSPSPVASVSPSPAGPSPSPVASPSPCVPVVDQPTKYYCVTKIIYSDTDCTTISAVLEGICVLGQTIIDETPLVEPCDCFEQTSLGQSVKYLIFYGPFDDAISCSFFCGSLSSGAASPGHNSDEYELCVQPSLSPSPSPTVSSPSPIVPSPSPLEPSPIGPSPSPVDVTCNSCEPALNETYTVTLAGLPAPYAAWNGANTVTWLSGGCQWIKQVGTQTLTLQDSGSGIWNVYINDSTIADCIITWDEFPPQTIPCAPTSAGYNLVICTDTGCAGMCAGGGSTSTCVVS